ncbi:MAG TPA: glycosyltransferase family 39 protein, partial [Anaeromyxobacteraceae bacterium]|nr:glycosyltransferase family 39 protein [Anaeromyxobacteraceae bacterium]
MLRGAPAAGPAPIRGPARAWIAPAAIAGAGVLLHLAAGDRYGFFRDELYFVVCGKHLAWGYVDQPPLGPVLARLAWALSGEGASVLAFRLPSIALGAASALLSAGLARRLGGGAFAMALAALLVATAPGEVAQAHLVTMNAVEPVLWSATVLAVLAATAGRPRAWLAAGLAVGAGLLTKYSMAFLALGLLAGLLATRARVTLRTPWVAAGVAGAALLVLPNLAWQAAHGLPFLELLRNGQAHKNAALGLGQLAGAVAVEQNPVGVLVALGGLAFLLARRRPAGPGTEGRSEPPARWLGLGLVLVLVALVTMGA